METKKIYEQPTTEVIEMKYEGMLCNSVSDPEEGYMQIRNDVTFKA